MKLPPVAIIAGGLATRMYPLTLKIPKSMIEVAGKPFIHHQLLLLKRNSVSEVILCIGNLGSTIRDYVRDGSSWGLKVSYSYDGDVQLGTGGALKRALPKLPSVFFIMYGDSYLDVEFEQVWKEFLVCNKPALMTVYHNRNKFDKSNVVLKDGRILEYGKEQSSEMEYIDYGLSVMYKRVLEEWTDKLAFDLGEVYRKLVISYEIGAFESKRRFYEIGSPSGLEELERYFASIATDIGGLPITP